jgi:hypothetical protein
MLAHEQVQLLLDIEPQIRHELRRNGIPCAGSKLGMCSSTLPSAKMAFSLCSANSLELGLLPPNDYGLLDISVMEINRERRLIYFQMEAPNGDLSVFDSMRFDEDVKIIGIILKSLANKCEKTCRVNPTTDTSSRYLRARRELAARSFVAERTLDGQDIAGDVSAATSSRMVGRNLTTLWSHLASRFHPRDEGPSPTFVEDQVLHELNSLNAEILLASVQGQEVNAFDPLCQTCDPVPDRLTAGS